MSEEKPPKGKRVKVAAKMETVMVRRNKARITAMKKREEHEQREIVMPKKIDFALLEKLGIGKQVMEKFKAIGWEQFLDWSTVTYIGLVKEIYSMLKVETDLGGVLAFM